MSIFARSVDLYLLSNFLLNCYIHGCSAADVIGHALRRHPFSSSIRIRIVLSGIKGGTRNASQSVELASVTLCAVQSVQIDVIYM